jgi:hypothetical protein
VSLNGFTFAFCDCNFGDQSKRTVAYTSLFDYALVFQRYRLMYADGILAHIAGQRKVDSPVVDIVLN